MSKTKKSREKKNKDKMFLKIYIIFLSVEKQFLMLLIAKHFKYKSKAKVFLDHFNLKILNNNLKILNKKCFKDYQ